jgi:hypothetical protein
MHKQLTEREAIERIQRNHGKVGAKTIEVDGCGLKVLAAVDCLVHYHGYTALVNNHRQFPMDWQAPAKERKARSLRILLAA